ncbi:hypothetical protein ACWO80_003611, partial [Vibrio cholerae]
MNTVTAKASGDTRWNCPFWAHRSIIEMQELCRGWHLGNIGLLILVILALLVATHNPGKSLVLLVILGFFRVEEQYSLLG